MAVVFLVLKDRFLSWSLELKSWFLTLWSGPGPSGKVLGCVLVSIFFVAFTKSFTAKPASKHTLHVRFYLLDIGRNRLFLKFSALI